MELSSAKLHCRCYPFITLFFRKCLDAVSELLTVTLMIFYQTRTSRRATCRGFPAFPFLVSLHIGPPAAVSQHFHSWCHSTSAHLPRFAAISVAGVTFACTPVMISVISVPGVPPRRATCRGFPAFPFLVSLHIGPPAAVCCDSRGRCDICVYTWHDFLDFCVRCHITASFLPRFTAISIPGVTPQRPPWHGLL